jgi:hypothetical protein
MQAFTMQTDASNFALGGVLLQEFQGQLHPVAFHSRKLNTAENNYSVHEREMLAVVDCVRSGHNTLLQLPPWCRQTTIRCNILQQPKLSVRQTRWLEVLQGYGISPVYKAQIKW